MQSMKLLNKAITEIAESIPPEQYWDKKGPIFFYTGNEGGITEFWNNSGFVFEAAEKFNALVIFGEHVRLNAFSVFETRDEDWRAVRWRSGESTRLPPMWPVFDSLTRRLLWTEFVGSLLCSERCFPGYSGFPLSSKKKKKSCLSSKKKKKNPAFDSI